MKKIQITLKGFTIIELLIVMAMIGILAAIGVPRLLEANTVNRLKAGQAELSQAFQRAQSLSRRYNYNYSIVISNDREYKLEPRNAANAVPTDAPTVNGKLESLIKIVPPTGTVAFTAPFSRLRANNRCYGIQLLSPSGTVIYETSIVLIGVTGKAVNRAIRTVC